MYFSPLDILLMMFGFKNPTPENFARNKCPDGPEFDLPISPYNRHMNNFMYNLIFCDVPELFAPSKLPPASWQNALYADNADVSEIRKIAESKSYESRVRLLAFNWLRVHQHKIDAQEFLGVVIEVSLRRGLDTLACFADGQVRYIHQSESIFVVESGSNYLSERIQKLISVASESYVIASLAKGQRKDWPKVGCFRITFLMSRGAESAEGIENQFQSDPFLGPIMFAGLDIITSIDRKPG
ncbi:MAG: hypothetical protein IPK50_11835 [Fibrobacterota bacterium]|nr:hypothetical protein [Fibrobacterota bacterium]QQS07562.1 MAG: hypothetical protein IPK50_11835 [Fibrobacterota bacterium]